MTDIQIVGHRGAKSEAPENTLVEIYHAAKIGLDAVEFDVHLSRDGHMVVIHDGTVDRTTNASGNVADFTASELAALDARETCPSWQDPVGVPELGQVVDIVGTFTTIQVEIKRDTPERLEKIVAGILREVDVRSLGSQVVITSFSAEAMEIVHRLAPGQSRGFIGRPEDMETVNTALRFGCDHVYFHNFRDHAPEQIKRAQQIGLRTGGGPVDSVVELHAAINLGLDTVTSDTPSTLRAYLAVI